MGQVASVGFGSAVLVSLVFARVELDDLSFEISLFCL